MNAPASSAAAASAAARPSPVTPDAGAIRDYMLALHGREPQGWLACWVRQTKATRAFDLRREDALEAAVKHLARAASTCDAYAGVCLLRSAPPPGGRGRADDAVSVPGVWLDLDVQGEAHRNENLPPDVETALEFLRHAAPEPSLVVHSGHGLQVFWLFPEPFLIESDDERARISSLVRRWQTMLLGAARLHGWVIDSTHDLARILRPAGTINRKVAGEERLVTVIRTGPRYQAGELEELLAPDDASEPRPKPNGHAAEGASDDAIQQAADILAAAWPPQGSRNRCFLALAGCLAARGVSQETATALAIATYERLWPANPDRRQAAAEVESTYRRFAAGETITGWTTLCSLIGEEAAASALALLGIERPAPGVRIERESAADWTDRLPRTRAGIRACQLSVELAFDLAPELQNTLVFDEFSGWIEVRRDLPWRAAGGVWTDADLSCLTSWLQTHGIYVTPAIAMDGVRVAAIKRKTHPVREYLTRLVWDGVKRIERMTEYYGAEPDPVVVDGLKRWIISAVARIMRPGCRADLMPVFEGKQGIAKSRSVEALFTPWFTDHLPDLRDKDAMLQLLGIWCLEISELRAFRGIEWETVKGFISQPTDRFRKPYDRLPAPHPRTCVFAGSTNTSEWLDDPTGGRRFIPVRCGVTRPRVDVDALARDRDAIWAQGVVLFGSGEPWWLPQELEAAAADLVDERYSADPWEAHISRYIALKDEVSTQELLESCLDLPKSQQTKGAQTRIGMIMARLGWRRARRQVGGRREHFYVAPQNE
jgi:predicted P-loop ATPase